MVSVPLCNVMASRIEKPSHMCDTMSMLGIVILLCVFCCLLVPKLSLCTFTSFTLFLAFWVSVMLSLCKVVGGILSAKLMASSRDIGMAA